MEAEVIATIGSESVPPDMADWIPLSTTALWSGVDSLGTDKVKIELIKYTKFRF